MKLKVEFVNPLLTGVYDVFRTMLNARAKYTGLAIPSKERAPNHVVTMIGLSGRVRGTVALVFPVETSRAVVEQLLGESVSDDSGDVADALAEIVNMVAGAGKAKLSELVGSTLELTLPTVVRGEEFEISSPSKALWIEVQFSSQIGPFSLRVNFEALPNI